VTAPASRHPPTATGWPPWKTSGAKTPSPISPCPNSTPAAPPSTRSQDRTPEDNDGRRSYRWAHEPGTTTSAILAFPNAWPPGFAPGCSHKRRPRLAAVGTGTGRPALALKRMAGGFVAISSYNQSMSPPSDPRPGFYVRWARWPWLAELMYQLERQRADGTCRNPNLPSLSRSYAEQNDAGKRLRLACRWSWQFW
jgi:hypothetical protein